ncbi:MAG: NifU family protein [Acidobacteriales bacterium]|nr:NifU family protein [Terriglobales bacterium]
MTQGREFNTRTERIEELISKLEAAGDPEFHAAALELLHCVMDLHGVALQRALDVLAQDPAGQELTSSLLADDLLSSVLLLHGLHPEDMETRVLRALAKIRPLLQPQGGEVEVLGMEGGAVRMLLHKSGGGCASTTLKLKNMVEDAIMEAAPDAEHIVVEVAQQPATPQLVTIK